MRVAIVLGFYDPVLVRLQRVFADRLADQTLIWISTIGPHGDGDIRNFKSMLFDRLARGTSELIVLAAVRRGRGQFGAEVAGVVESARKRHEEVKLSLRTYEYALSDLEPEVVGFFAVPATDEGLPDRLGDLESWYKSSKILKERLVILPAAMREVTGSAFEDAELVYRSLSLLAHEYWDLRASGGIENRKRWHAGLEMLGLKVAPSISKTSSGRQKLEYHVNYPVGSQPGNSRFLEQHLKKGADRDQRYCFRAYFFWDMERSVVVVGWLPSHLDTEST